MFAHRSYVVLEIFQLSNYSCSTIGVKLICELNSSYGMYSDLKSASLHFFLEHYIVSIMSLYILCSGAY